MIMGESGESELGAEGEVFVADVGRRARAESGHQKLAPRNRVKTHHTTLCNCQIS